MWKNISLQVKVFIFTLTIGMLTLNVSMLIFYYSIRESMQGQLENHAKDIAQLASARVDARMAYSDKNPADKLQEIASEIVRRTDAAFVVYMNMDGIRYSHPNTDLVGKQFTGDDEGPALTGHTYTSRAVGISGPSIRGFVPIYDFGQKQVGAVAVGFFEPNIKVIMSKVFGIFYIVIPFSFVSMVIVSWLLAFSIKRAMFGMEPREIATLLEERELMLQSVREGIIAIDVNNRATVINQTAQKLFSPGTVIIGRNIADVLPNSRLPVVMETRQGEYDQPMVINNTTVLTNRVPMIVAGEVVGAIATFRDLTEVKRLAQELTGVKKVVNALRAKTHEFMNQMHIVSGLIQLGDYDEAQKFITNLTNRDQALISFIIDNIKSPAVVGLLVGKASEAKEMHVGFHVDESSRLHYLPDHFEENFFTVVLGNLVDNALQAVKDMPSGRKQVEVAIYQDERWINILVKDYGQGIEEHIKDRIFDPGFTTKQTGMGYGLNNLYKRIKLSQGTISLETGSGGTTFTIRIPNLLSNR